MSAEADSGINPQRSFAQFFDVVPMLRASPVVCAVTASNRHTIYPSNEGRAVVSLGGWRLQGCGSNGLAPWYPTLAGKAPSRMGHP